MIPFLPALFFLTALFYASVGFGGGSTYNALLILSGVDYRLIPSIALLCNIIVVTGGVWRFSLAGHIQITKLLPLIAGSIPAAWIGGWLPISEIIFVGILGFALLASGLHLAFGTSQESSPKTAHYSTSPMMLVAGVGLGFLAGISGIGGGIFLAPILYFLRWGSAKEIAAACSLFILVNSISGLGGQIIKLTDLGVLKELSTFWPLIPAVLIGGQIGSHLGAVGLKPTLIKRLTAVLILYVSIRLLFRWAGLIL
ncbi:MAG: UPF0721 transmembrane protein [Hyphococcus sp.]|nr:MAG: UPF0721 transmembrane protein [Marinicaulis sp.]